MYQKSVVNRINFFQMFLISCFVKRNHSYFLPKPLVWFLQAFVTVKIIYEHCINFKENTYRYLHTQETHTQSDHQLTHFTYDEKDLSQSCPLAVTSLKMDVSVMSESDLFVWVVFGCHSDKMSSFLFLLLIGNQQNRVISNKSGTTLDLIILKVDNCSNSLQPITTLRGRLKKARGTHQDTTTCPHFLRRENEKCVHRVCLLGRKKSD